MDEGGRAGFLWTKLAFVNGAVYIRRLEQLSVCAAGSDTAFFEHEDAVSPAHGAETVCDYKGGAPLHEYFEGILDQMLGFGIYRCGSVIENKDARVKEQSTGDGHTLFLPTGKVDAALAYMGIVAKGQAGDEIVDLGSLGSGNDLLQAGLRTAESDILAQGGGEEGELCNTMPI